MAGEYLLVDGHSVVFGWPEWRRLHTRRNAAGRDALARVLTDYQDQTGVRVVLVFDGRGGRIAEESEPGGIQIFYAPAGRTADEVLERLVAKYAGEHRLTVASSDGLVRQTAISFGAEGCIDVAQLQELLEVSGKDFARRSRAYRRTAHR